MQPTLPALHAWAIVNCLLDGTNHTACLPSRTLICQRPRQLLASAEKDADERHSPGISQEVLTLDIGTATFVQMAGLCGLVGRSPLLGSTPHIWLK